MVDQFDALLNIHTMPKDIILDAGVVLSIECSTTTKTDSYVDQSLTSSILSVPINALHSVQEELETVSTLTPVIGILSPVACPMVESLTTSNLLFSKFPQPFTIISSIPTDLRLVSCRPNIIMSPCVQQRTDYELQFNTINTHNIIRSTTFIYGPYLFPVIEHFQYTMNICDYGKYRTPVKNVTKATCETQVTQSFKLKCVEKISVTKQQNGNGVNLYYPTYNFNNNVLNETNI